MDKWPPNLITNLSPSTTSGAYRSSGLSTIGLPRKGETRNTTGNF
jgi:hypothetical protein